MCSTSSLAAALFEKQAHFTQQLWNLTGMNTRPTASKDQQRVLRRSLIATGQDNGFAQGELTELKKRLPVHTLQAVSLARVSGENRRLMM